MGIETVYYIFSPEDSNYKPKIVPPGTYYCIHYPKCKGKQIVRFRDGELKPCPLCGSRVMFSQ